MKLEQLPSEIEPVTIDVKTMSLNQNQTHGHIKKRMDRMMKLMQLSSLKLVLKVPHLLNLGSHLLECPEQLVKGKH